MGTSGGSQASKARFHLQKPLELSTCIQISLNKCVEQGTPVRLPLGVFSLRMCTAAPLWGTPLLLSFVAFAREKQKPLSQCTQPYMI